MASFSEPVMSGLTLTRFSEALIANVTRLKNLEEKLVTVANLINFTSKNINVLAVGKNCYIAEKFVASLRSIGVRAAFIHATEAMHGDLGQVDPESLVFGISKSGSTTELIRPLRELRTRSCQIVAITNIEESTLGKIANFVIPLRNTTEGEPLEMLPLVSTQVTLFVCDFLVAKVAESKELSKTDFLNHHPNGQLGFGLRQSLSDLDVWRSRLAFVESTTAISDALLVASEHRTGLVCVLNDNNEVMGIVTDGDFRRALQKRIDLVSTPVKFVMNESPLILQSNISVQEALAAMQSAHEHPVFAAPVVDQAGCCLGVVLLHDLLLNSN